MKTLKFFVFLLLLLGALPAQAEFVKGVVVQVADGDTVVLLVGDQTQHRVRLLGIDAPENSQAFGRRAKHQLSSLVLGRDVRADCPRTDRFNRRVCRLVVDGTDINLNMIERG